MNVDIVYKENSIIKLVNVYIIVKKNESSICGNCVFADKETDNCFLNVILRNKNISCINKTGNFIFKTIE